MVLFGLAFMFTRKALVSASIFTLLSWRFFLAFFLMTALRVLGIWKIDLKGLPLSLLCIGLFQPVMYFFFETTGIRMTSVAEAGIITSMIPIVSMIMAVLFLREYPAWLQLISIILSVLGTIVVVLGQDITSPTFHLLGYFALFGSVTSAALFMVFSRRTVNYSSSAKAYVMLGVGFVAFTAAAAVEHLRNGTVVKWLTLPAYDMNFLGAILYLGTITSVAGMWAMNLSIERLGVHRASTFAGVATVVSVITGVFIMRESLTFAQVLGMIMILLGVAGVNKFARDPNKTEKQYAKQA